MRNQPKNRWKGLKNPQKNIKKLTKKNKNCNGCYILSLALRLEIHVFECNYLLYLIREAFMKFSIIILVSFLKPDNWSESTIQETAAWCHHYEASHPDTVLENEKLSSSSRHSPRRWNIIIIHTQSWKMKHHHHHLNTVLEDETSSLSSSRHSPGPGRWNPRNANIVWHFSIVWWFGKDILDLYYILPFLCYECWCRQTPPAVHKTSCKSSLGWPQCTEHETECSHCKEKLRYHIICDR